MYMAAKKKTSLKGAKKSASSEPEQPKPERMVAVTEIVEVLEESAPPQAPEAFPDLPPEEKEEKLVDTQPDSPKEEKTKEIVEGLFKSEESSVLPEISVHTHEAKRLPLIWALAVIALALVTGGSMLVVRSGLPRFSFFTPKAPTPTSTPAPTLAPVKREDLTVEVLNGGGTPGAAGKMKKSLEEKGYKVASVGNTDEYTYDWTEIQVKAGKEAFILLLEMDLKDNYTLGTSAATLSSDAASDARVTVGK